MSEVDYRAVLLDMIRKLLTGSWSVPEFRANYYDFVIDGVPDYELSDIEETFFSGVQEKLDWVDSRPDAESRKHGWINHDEFIEWLKNELESFVELEKRIGQGHST